VQPGVWSKAAKEGSTKGPAGHVNHSPRAAFTEREGKRGIGRIELLLPTHETSSVLQCESPLCVECLVKCNV
jgi:hypothetical protein